MCAHACVCTCACACLGGGWGGLASLCVIVHDSAREGEKVCDRVEGGERVKRLRGQKRRRGGDWEREREREAWEGQ